eukprot:4688409-Amphidinium_carterae.1
MNFACAGPWEAQFARKSQAVNTDVAAVKIVQVLLLAGRAIFREQNNADQHRYPIGRHCFVLQLTC